MAIEIKADTRKLEEMLRATPQELTRALTASAHRAAQRFLSYHRRTRMHGDPGVKGTRGTEQNPGFLSSRVSNYEVSGQALDSLTLTMRIKSPIAVLHEKGGTLTARRSSFVKTPQFSIPFEKLGRSGWKKARKLLADTKLAYRARTELNIDLFRYTTGTGDKRRVLKSPQRIKEQLFVVRKRDGTLFLGQRIPNAPKAWGAKRARLWFHLQPKVTYPPRLGFFDSWKEFQPKANDLLRGGVKFALEAARRKRGQ